MTPQNDQHPGWWRRGMTQRGTRIVIVVCVAIIVTGLVVVAVSGIPLF